MVTTKEKFGKTVKKQMVSEIVSKVKARPNFIITSFMGSSTADLEQLRREARKIDSRYLVVKNSILKVVFDELKLQDEASTIDSGMGLLLSGEDIVSTCKALDAFAKTHDKLKVKGAVIDGKPVSPDKYKVIAALPPKQVLLAQVVGGIKAPITGFVSVLGGVLRKFVYVVDAIKTEKGKAAPAAAPAAEAKPA